MTTTRWLWWSIALLVSVPAFGEDTPPDPQEPEFKLYEEIGLIDMDDLVPVPDYSPSLSLVQGGLRTHRFKTTRTDQGLLLFVAMGAAATHAGPRILAPEFADSQLDSPQWLGAAAIVPMGIALLPTESGFGSSDRSRRAAARHAGRVLIIGESVLLAEVVNRSLSLAASTGKNPTANWWSGTTQLSLATSATTASWVTRLESRKHRGWSINEPHSLLAVMLPMAAGVTAAAFAKPENTFAVGLIDGREVAQVYRPCDCSDWPKYIAPVVGSLAGLIVPVLH